MAKSERLAMSLCSSKEFFASFFCKATLAIKHILNVSYRSEPKVWLATKLFPGLHWHKLDLSWFGVNLELVEDKVCIAGNHILLCCNTGCSDSSCFNTLSC